MSKAAEHTWKETTLGQVCELKRGYDLPKASRKSGDVPVISSSGVSGFHSQAKVQAPGVVTGRYGTLGEVFYVTEPFWPLNTALYVRDFKGNDPRFVAALLESMNLGQHDGAAAVPGLNRNQLHGLPVRVPDRSVQEGIAGALVALDDLLENSRRRAKVIGDLMRNLYREWFIRFRYPGHEEVSLADSRLGQIPKGWDVQPFSEVASFVNGYAFGPANWGESGRPIIKIKQLKQGVSTETPRCDPLSIDRKYWIEPGDLLFSWSADLGVYRWTDEPGLLNQHLFVVVPTATLSAGFLYHAIEAAMPQFWDRAQGTTMRHIKRSALSEVSTVVPDADLVGRFAALVKPMEHEVDQLQRSVRNLAAVRHLLLPRLVTGKVELSSLGLNALLEKSQT